MRVQSGLALAWAIAVRSEQLGPGQVPGASASVRTVIDRCAGLGGGRRRPGEHAECDEGGQAEGEPTERVPERLIGCASLHEALDAQLAPMLPAGLDTPAGRSIDLAVGRVEC